MGCPCDVSIVRGFPSYQVSWVGLPECCVAVDEAKALLQVKDGERERRMTSLPITSLKIFQLLTAVHRMIGISSISHPLVKYTSGQVCTVSSLSYRKSLNCTAWTSPLALWQLPECAAGAQHSRHNFQGDEAISWDASISTSAASWGDTLTRSKKSCYFLERGRYLFWRGARRYSTAEQARSILSAGTRRCKLGCASCCVYGSYTYVTFFKPQSYKSTKVSSTWKSVSWHVKAIIRFQMKQQQRIFISFCILCTSRAPYPSLLRVPDAIAAVVYFTLLMLTWKSGRMIQLYRKMCTLFWSVSIGAWKVFVAMVHLMLLNRVVSSLGHPFRT